MLLLNHLSRLLFLYLKKYRYSPVFVPQFQHISLSSDLFPELLTYINPLIRHFYQVMVPPLPPNPVIQLAISIVWLGPVLQTISCPLWLRCGCQYCQRVLVLDSAPESVSLWLSFLQLCYSLWSEESVGPWKRAYPVHHIIATQDPRNPCQQTSFPGLFFQEWTASLVGTP